MRKSILALGLSAGLIITANVQADATIQFQVQDGSDGSSQSQTAYIKNGLLMVKQAGGDPKIDLLYQQSNASMTIINHEEQTYMTLDEQKIEQFAGQAQGMMSAMQKQLAAQLANLPPEQAAKVREMMGGFGGGQADAPPKPATKLVKKGTKTVNGFKCRQHDVLEDGQKTAEMCLAEPGALGLSAADYAVVQSMQQMGARMAEKARQFSQSFGNKVPDLAFGDIEGVPIEMRDLSQGAPSSMSVTKIASGAGKVAMTVPEGYRPQALPALPKM